MALSFRGPMTWIVLPLVLYLLWGAALFLGQRGMLFVGRSLPAPPQPTLDEDVETWWLSTPVGDVEAWYHRPARAGDEPSADSGPAVIFAHGNGERIDDWTGAYQLLADRGVAVLLVEYPGYGRSDGAPTQETVTETLTAAFDRLAARPEVDPSRVVGLGRSLGGGAVAVLSRHRPLRALVLQSTFTSVRAFARRYLLPSLLVRDPFDALAAVRLFDGPILVVHGERDRVIPYRHGQRLARAASRARLLTWPCGHNDCPPDWGVWLEELTGFLEDEEILR